MTLLLVEDDENDIVLIRRAIERLQIIHRLVVEQDSEQLIPYLCGTGPYSNRQAYPFPDVLFLDRCMPHLGAIDLLFWLRTEPRFKALPVVVLSGEYSPPQAALVRRLQAAPCIKCMALSEMLNAIHSKIDCALAIVGGATG